MEVDQELLKVKASGSPMFSTHPTQMNEEKQEFFTNTLCRKIDILRGQSQKLTS